MSTRSPVRATAPTVFADVTGDMAIVREELFGPVTAIIPFETVRDAIRIANDTSYGLANGLWTTDPNKATEVIRALQSSTIYVNTYLETIPQMPFGGLKERGLGKENGTKGQRNSWTPRPPSSSKRPVPDSTYLKELRFVMRGCYSAPRPTSGSVPLTRPNKHFTSPRTGVPPARRPGRRRHR